VTEALLDAPDSVLGRSRAGARHAPCVLVRPDDKHFGGETLDELIVDAWEGIAADRTASCPLCSGSLEPRFGAGPRPVAGICRDCGSTLS